MGGGQIFLKTRRDASFNKDLSNEPTFDWIHLAGQYLRGSRQLVYSATAESNGFKNSVSFVCLIWRVWRSGFFEQKL